MMHSSRENGSGGLNAIFGLLLLLVVGLMLFQILPAQQRRSQLKDFMVEQTQTVGRKSGAALEKALYKKAVELKVPLEKKNIEVHKTGKQVRLKCTYIEPLNFVIYTHKWEIDLKVDRPIYSF